MTIIYYKHLALLVWYIYIAKKQLLRVADIGQKKGRFGVSIYNKKAAVIL
jgi:hypothetical protein